MDQVRGKLVRSKKKIFFNYLKGYLLIDLTIYIVYMVSIEDNKKYLSFILFLQAHKITMILLKLENLIDLKEITQAIYELFKLILLILFVAHICGCIFFYISYQEHKSGKMGGWVEKFELIDKDWAERVKKLILSPSRFEFNLSFYYSHYYCCHNCYLC